MGAKILLSEDGSSAQRATYASSAWEGGLVFGDGPLPAREAGLQVDTGESRAFGRRIQVHIWGEDDTFDIIRFDHFLGKFFARLMELLGLESLDMFKGIQTLIETWSFLPPKRVKCTSRRWFRLRHLCR